ncbi:MAG TPA: nitrilase family protein [Saprospiraceae bacterium]|nr:nitrilase family protein [Saprospiraceae bacterium]
MRLTIVQSALTWENPVANRAMFSQKFALLRGATDLVVLPEMFSTGFSMNAAALAEPMDGMTIKWLESTAKDLGAAMVGSFICADDGKYFNRLVFMRPDGQFDVYDKKHLFSLAGEQEYFSPGEKRITVEWQGWRICPLVCYDLRFPVWSRNPTPGPSPTGRGDVAYTAGRSAALVEEHSTSPLPMGEGPGVGLNATSYDLLIYVANWPARRAHHWRSLLTARAIENQAFVAGVNIFGTDGNGLEYQGDSAIIDYAGQTVFQISGQEDMFTAELSLGDLQLYRRQLPFLQDADVFQLC